MVARHFAQQIVFVLSAFLLFTILEQICFFLNSMHTLLICTVFTVNENQFSFKVHPDQHIHKDEVFPLYSTIFTGPPFLMTCDFECMSLLQCNFFKCSIDLERK